MQEGIFLEADIDEGGLQTIFQVADLALENAAHEPFFRGAFNGEFFETPLLQHRDARFERLGVDDDFLVNFLHWLDHPLHPLDNLVRRALDRFDKIFRLFGNIDRLETFLLLHLGGRFQMRLAEFAALLLLAISGDRLGGGHAFRRQTGGDVFGAFDLLLISVALVNRFGAGDFFADGIGARVIGGAVGPALLTTTTTAATATATTTLGTEAHAAATAATKVLFIFTHSF